MTINEDRLRQTFSEGGAQEIYQEVKVSGDFLSFARHYAFSEDYRMARSALWGLTKASKEELSQLQVILCLLHVDVGNRMTVDSQFWHCCIFLPFTPCFQMVDNRSLNPTRPLL